MRPGTVYVGNIHGQEVSAAFMSSFVKATRHPRVIAWGSDLCHATRLAEGRNNITGYFLNSQAEWLWWLDSDMAIRPDCLNHLIAAVHPTERPIVGALCFAYKIDTIDPDFGTPIVRTEPTIYAWDDEQIGFVEAEDFKPDTLIRCGGTGSACILIHRTVMETIGEDWYTQLTFPEGRLAEDMSFCLRAITAGFPIYVHTGIPTKHAKTVYLDEDYWRREAA